MSKFFFTFIQKIITSNMHFLLFNFYLMSTQKLIWPLMKSPIRKGGFFRKVKYNSASRGIVQPLLPAEAGKIDAEIAETALSGWKLF
jgi:hypothetical protein